MERSDEIDLDPLPVDEPEGTRRTLSRMFGLDLRSLAALRVAVAATLILDLYQRCKYLDAWYTDDGVLPRTAKMAIDASGGMREYWWSLHMLSGEAALQWVLMGASLWFGLLMLIGYRTRVATVATLVLLLSVQYRNTRISQGGDVMVRCFLLWMCFLPIGARWSVDNALRRDRRQLLPVRIVTMASVAFLFQLVLVYVCSAWHKSGTPWRSSYTAVWMALHNEHFASAFGHWLRQHPTPCMVLTATTVYWEFVGPFLLFSPVASDRLRGLSALGFIGFHVGLVLAMSLGMFPWIAIAIWLGALPAGFWDGLARWWRPRDDGLLAMRAGPDARRSARLWREAFGLGARVPIEPGDGPTWQVVEPGGRALEGAAAIRALARHSPLLGPLGPLVGAALGPIAPLARWWRTPWFADRRGQWFGRPEWFRHPAPIPIHQSLATTLILFLLLGYTLAWNFRNKNWEYMERRILPKEWNALGRATGLNQHWGLFAPYPLRDGGWYVLRGTLGNGKVVDLWSIVDGRMAAASDAELYEGPDDALALTPETRPKVGSEVYPNEDWQKYMVNLWKDYNRKRRRTRHHRYLVRWLERTWTARIDATPGYSREEQDPLYEELEDVQAIINEARKEDRDPPPETLKRRAELHARIDALAERRNARRLDKIEILFFRERTRWAHYEKTTDDKGAETRTPLPPEKWRSPPRKIVMYTWTR